MTRFAIPEGVTRHAIPAGAKGALVAAALALVLAAPAVALATAQEHAPPHPGETAAAAEPGKEAEGVEEEHGPRPINFFDFGNKEQPPYAAALLNFGVLMFLYYSFGKKPVAQALKDRRATVAKEIEEAQRMKHEAEGRATKYQAQFAHLADEQKATTKALQEAGKLEGEHIVKEAEEKAARMQKDAAFLLEQEAKQTQQDLQREAVDLAVAAAEDLLKKRLTAEDHERVAEEFLRSLEQRGEIRA